MQRKVLQDHSSHTGPGEARQQGDPTSITGNAQDGVGSKVGVDFTTAQFVKAQSLELAVLPGSGHTAASQRTGSVQDPL